MKKVLVIILFLLIVACQSNNIVETDDIVPNIIIKQNQVFDKIDQKLFLNLIKSKYDSIELFNLETNVGDHAIPITLTINNKKYNTIVKYTIKAKNKELKPYLYNKPDGKIGYKTLAYNHIEEITNPHDLLVLVNKEFKVPDDFIPKNLVAVDKKYTYKGYDIMMNEQAYQAFKMMEKAMADEGLDLKVSSCYRSVNYQKGLYNRYLKSDPREKVDTYSARYGHSEHHTGYACDFSTTTKAITYFNNTKEAKWLANNAYKYGWILRYLKETTSITGYMGEPWHYRYLGPEIAKKVYDSGLTYEEYYFNYIKEN